ncbi:hypothetical protein AAFC00_004217 [Neodothiora populina]|uniref:Copper-fist domain-containing protein n=1 Tax=Neodothiora populina TaxID=2781224 RepID=A0ABR3PIZ8_9PEZI
MVVKEDGTKWACASCLKGHRVSGCTHVDRELTFVPKKGRPVTQCPHCRSERKKRSAHVKCDCGEKPHPKEKCIHLREAEAKAAGVAANGCTGSTTPPGSSTPDTDEIHASVHELGPVPEETSADHHHCCCPHGGKCTCASHSTESPEPRGESPTKAISTIPKSKPRLTTRSSEGHLAMYSNGHHKPAHRHNNAAHESGAPYKLPRSHTAHSGQNISRRSVDSLASLRAKSSMTWQPLSLTAAAVQPTPVEPVKIQSKQSSPTLDQSMSHQSPFDINMPIESSSYMSSEASTSVASNSTMYQEFGFPSAQSGMSIATSSTDPSAFSLPGSVPTSAMDFDNTKTTDFWASMDWNRLDPGSLDAQPALTNASSGTISEIDDLPRVDDLSGFDAQYSMDSQAPLTGFDYGNDFAADNNAFGATFDTNTSSPNRWSMPVFSSQENTMMVLPTESSNSSTKDMSLHDFGVSQPLFQTQPMMSNVGESVHSQSPLEQSPPNMFQQDKTSGIHSYNWEALMPDFSSGLVSSNDGSNHGMDFGAGDSSQQSMVGEQQACSMPSNTGLEDFNNSYRTMQWDDGMSMPADQDFVNSYNMDTNWSSSSFDAPWS